MSNEAITEVTPPKPWLPIIATASTIGLILAIVALIFSLGQRRVPQAAVEPSTLNRILSTQTLRVGYEGYPPYTMKDPKTGKLTGFSVDLAEYIAREAGWTVEWIQTSPDTKIPDLQSGRFDVMTEPIFYTIPRGTQVCFSRAYAYFGDAVGIVRKHETRFKAIGDLNKPGVTIAVRQGYTDQKFASDNFPLASIRILKVDDVSQVFLDVIAKKADIALADLEQAKAFAAKHGSEVETRFTDPAPAYIPAGLMLKQGDFVFYNFVNTSLDYMQSNGVLKRLNLKYSISPGQPPPAS